MLWQFWKKKKYYCWKEEIGLVPSILYHWHKHSKTFGLLKDQRWIWAWLCWYWTLLFTGVLLVQFIFYHKMSMDQYISWCVGGERVGLEWSISTQPSWHCLVPWFHLYHVRDEYTISPTLANIYLCRYTAMTSGSKLYFTDSMSHNTRKFWITIRAGGLDFAKPLLEPMLEYC